MNHSLKLATTDARESVTRILNRAVSAPESEVSGLTAALESLLSPDERAPAEIVSELRAGRGSENHCAHRRLRSWLGHALRHGRRRAADNARAKHTGLKRTAEAVMVADRSAVAVDALKRAKRTIELEGEVVVLIADLVLAPFRVVKTVDRDGLLALVGVASATASVELVLLGGVRFVPVLGALLLGRVYFACAQHISRDSLLDIVYRGTPMTVDVSNITDAMCVPALGGSQRLGDIDAGTIAADLFTEALAKRALVAPDGVRVDCYADDDEVGGGFVLVAYTSDGQSSRGLTSGWRDARNISAAEDADPHDPKLIRAALEFFASECNHALGIDRHPAAAR